MNSFGNRIRELRMHRNIKQRQIATILETDTAFISKIENGARQPKREQVIVLARLFNIDESKFLALWMGDRIVQEIKHEVFAREALEIAEKIIYQMEGGRG